MFVDRFGRSLSFSTFPAARHLLVPKTALRAIAGEAGRRIWQCNEKNVTFVLVVDKLHADLVPGIVFGCSASAWIGRHTFPVNFQLPPANLRFLHITLSVMDLYHIGIKDEQDNRGGSCFGILFESSASQKSVRPARHTNFTRHMIPSFLPLNLSVTDLYHIGINE